MPFVLRVTLISIRFRRLIEAMNRPTAARNASTAMVRSTVYRWRSSWSTAVPILRVVSVWALAKYVRSLASGCRGVGVVGDGEAQAGQRHPRVPGLHHPLPLTCDAHECLFSA